MTKASTIEPWNREALEEARRYNLQQIYILVTPTEYDALLDFVVGTDLQRRLRENSISRDV